MSKAIDIMLVTALLCTLATLFLAIKQIRVLETQIKARNTCERLGMEVKTSHYDKKLNVIRIKCQAKIGREK